MTIAKTSIWRGIQVEETPPLTQLLLLEFGMSLWSPTHHVVVSRHHAIASMVLSRPVFLPARVSQHIYLLGPSATSAFLGLTYLSRSCSRILCLRQSSISSSQSDSYYIGTSWPSDWRPCAEYSGNLEDAWISDHSMDRETQTSLGVATFCSH